MNDWDQEAQVLTTEREEKEVQILERTAKKKVLFFKMKSVLGNIGKINKTKKDEWSLLK